MLYPPSSFPLSLVYLFIYLFVSLVSYLQGLYVQLL